MKEKTGNDPEVQDYVMQNDKGPIFLEKLKDMVEFLIPNYILEGKNQLVIAMRYITRLRQRKVMASVLNIVISGRIVSQRESKRWKICHFLEK